MAGIQRVVINQPGLRPGQPGAQITVPLSTLQVSNCLHLSISLVTNSSLIPICAGASGWPGNPHWSAWPPLGQDRNWPVSGELNHIVIHGPKLIQNNLQILRMYLELQSSAIRNPQILKSGPKDKKYWNEDSLNDRPTLRYYEWVHPVLEVPLPPPLSQSNPCYSR